MTDDITPGLLKKIQDDFQKNFDKSAVISDLYKKVRDGTATYKEANEFAIEIGDILAGAFKSNLSSNVLPNGRMYYNIAQRIIEPTMKNNYDLITDVTNQVQTSLNKASRIGIKAIKPDLNQDRIHGIVNKVSDAEVFDDVAWVLDEPIRVFSQSIVDDAIKANADFQYSTGLSPKIERTTSGNCCEWCKNLAGVYSYPDVPKEVYQRHDYCRCKVDYLAGKKRENIHHGNTGKRRYVKDEYNTYVKTKEERIAHAKQMADTEKERKEIARQKRIATWEKKKSGTALGKLTDVTDEYKRKIGLEKGKLVIEDGYELKGHEKEINVAEYLSKNFGGDIKVLKEINEHKVYTPDYIWNDKFWELKSPDSASLNAIDKRLQKGLHQIEDNPGGIIINLNRNELDIDDIARKIENRLTRHTSNNISCDVIVMIEGKMKMVIRK